MPQNPLEGTAESLIIKATELYAISDELGIVSNQLQILGAMIAAIGNSYGIVSSDYALLADKIQLTALLMNQESKKKEGHESGRRYGREIDRLSEESDIQKNELERIKQQILRLQHQVEEMHKFLGNDNK